MIRGLFIWVVRGIAAWAVPGPEQPCPIAKNPGIHADRPRHPGSDALLSGQGCSVLLESIIAFMQQPLPQICTFGSGAIYRASISNTMASGMRDKSRRYRKNEFSVDKLTVTQQLC